MQLSVLGRGISKCQALQPCWHQAEFFFPGGTWRLNEIWTRQNTFTGWLKALSLYQPQSSSVLYAALHSGLPLQLQGKTGPGDERDLPKGTGKLTLERKRRPLAGLDVTQGPDFSSHRRDVQRPEASISDKHPEKHYLEETHCQPPPTK